MHCCDTLILNLVTVCCKCCEIPSRLGTCSKQLPLVDYLTQANKDQLLPGFCYFLCCVFNVCIKSVYNTYRNFDGYFWRKKGILYTGKYGTVEPCYLELKPISLGFALLFSVITIGYLELSYLKLPISNKEQQPLFLFHRQIYPTISNSQLYVLSKLLLPSRVQD